MKTHKNLYNNMLNKVLISGAIDTASNHKRKREDVQEVLQNKDYHVDIVYDMLVNRTYKPELYGLHRIIEGANHKIRFIEKPHFRYDQIVQHVVITQLKPIILKSLYVHAHGALTGRGPLQTAEVISKWLKNDIKGTRYCLQMDIHKCYPSIDKEILIQMYHEKIKDDDFNKINDDIIRSSPVGLALGAPTSVWHQHFLFTPFDHWVSSLDGVHHYIRHVDDLIIFGSNKRKLHKVEQQVIEYLHDKLKLDVNKNHQVFPIEWKNKYGEIKGRPLDVCGYLFYRNKRILRKSRILGITRKASKINKKQQITFYDSQQMISKLGGLKHSDTFNMSKEYIFPKVSKGQLTKLISKHKKKENFERRMQWLTEQWKVIRKQDH